MPLRRFPRLSLFLGEFLHWPSASIPLLPAAFQSLGCSPVEARCPLTPHSPTLRCSSSLPLREIGQGREEAPLCPDLIPCCSIKSKLRVFLFCPERKKKKSIPRACPKVVAVGVRRLLALGLALKIDWASPGAGLRSPEKRVASVTLWGPGKVPAISK